MDLKINLTTEEERERYNYIKELTTKLYPHISQDQTLANMSEYLLIHYAKHQQFPDPIEERPISQNTSNILAEEIYYTPSNVGDTLQRPEI